MVRRFQLFVQTQPEVKGVCGLPLVALTTMGDCVEAYSNTRQRFATPMCASTVPEMMGESIGLDRLPCGALPGKLLRVAQTLGDE